MFDSYQNFNEFNNVMTEEEKEERRKFESEERLDLKKLLTVISKYKLEDVTSIKKECLSCTKKCYEKADYTNLNQEEITNLSFCKDECKSSLRDVYAFLNNINFLSEEKMKNCLERCDKVKEAKGQNFNLIKEGFNNCAWMCYNKLDRRYKNYWRNKRDKIIERHLYKTLDE